MFYNNFEQCSQGIMTEEERTEITATIVRAVEAELHRQFVELDRKNAENKRSH